MAVKLDVMNGALMAIGSARLATVSDVVKARYELDAIYSQVLAECLEAGQWNFAIRTIKADRDQYERVNLLPYAQEFNQWTAVNTTVTANDETAPDGTATADLAVPTTTSAVHTLAEVIAAGNDLIGQNVLSVYAKASGYGHIYLHETATGAPGRTYFNLITGAVGTTDADHTAFIEEAANGFWRCSVYFSGVAALTAVTAGVGVASADGTSSFAGDAAAGVHLWHAQLEKGQIATAPLVTTTASDTGDITGFKYRFAKPSDWVRTTMVSADGSFTDPLQLFDDIDVSWYANVDPIYVRFVSNHATNGGGLLTRWPALYTHYVELALAERVCLALNGSASMHDELTQKRLPKAKSRALSIDAINGPPRFMPVGRFVRSRGTGVPSTRYDRATS